MESRNPQRSSRSFAVAVGVCAACLAACADTPPAPAAALASAHLAITNAERAEAGRYAPNDLAEARAKLNAADAEVTGKRMLVAERLANESRTEAELASANTTAIKASAVNGDMERSNRALVEEMQRKSGDKQ